MHTYVYMYIHPLFQSRLRSPPANSVACRSVDKTRQATEFAGGERSLYNTKESKTNKPTKNRASPGWAPLVGIRFVRFTSKIYPMESVLLIFFRKKSLKNKVSTIKIHFKYMFNLFLLGCEFVFKGGKPGPINNFVKTSFFHHSGNKLAQFTPRPPRPQFET